MGGGGQDGPLADSWVLDFQGQRWLPYRVLNQGARAWHAACVAISAEVPDCLGRISLMSAGLSSASFFLVKPQAKPLLVSGLCMPS